MTKGFEGRIFLLDYEWETYQKRMPVRYIKKRHANLCQICGKPPTQDNPLQNAHKIPFIKGVNKYRLTPDFLDRDENIVCAHRKKCNSLAEMTDEEISDYLSKL
jgi:hypothetical protein